MPNVPHKSTETDGTRNRRSLNSEKAMTMDAALSLGKFNASWPPTLGFVLRDKKSNQEIKYVSSSSTSTRYYLIRTTGSVIVSEIQDSLHNRLWHAAVFLSAWVTTVIGGNILYWVYRL